MIDLTLLPKEWRSGWLPVCAAPSGEGLHSRSTLRLGDWLVRSSKTFEEIKAAGNAVSFSVSPNPPTVIIGRDVSIGQLYPDLWGDWNWEDAH